MKRREVLLLSIGLLLMAGGAGGLRHLKENQRLGDPGIKSTPIEGSLRRTIELPLSLPGYKAESLSIESNVVEALPQDTSFARVGYTDSDGATIQVMAVMMGTDRTSLHKPQFCLTGQGWNIDEARSSREVIHFAEPVAFDLPVMKLVSSKTVEKNGVKATFSGVYVYWFVAEDAVTEDHWQRMWWMAEHLVRDGELQRWAYISFFMPCPPGKEEAAFERVKKLIEISAPRFQLAWPGGKGAP